MAPMAFPPLLALLALCCAIAAAQVPNSTAAVARTFPYGAGSLSSDGRYVCFLTSSQAYTNTVCYLPTYDTSSVCTGSIGSYYCTTQYSYASTSVRSQSTSYTGGGGRCYESPGAAYSDTPCSWNDIRMDYSQTGACSGISYGVYVYYCPASYSSMNSYTGLTSSGGPTAGGTTTCYITANECAYQTSCSYSCLYDSNNKCTLSSGYYAYCPSSALGYGFSTIGVLCYGSSSTCYNSYNRTCVADTAVCSGAGSGNSNYSPSSSTVYDWVGLSGGSADGFCYASNAAATYWTGCTSSAILSGSTNSGACSGANTGFVYYCPSASASYAWSASVNPCFSSASACNTYHVSSSCVADSAVCAGAGGNTYYSPSSNYASSSSTSSTPLANLCFVSQAAATAQLGCTTPLRDSAQSGACSGATASFTYYCSRSASPPPPSPPPLIVTPTPTTTPSGSTCNTASCSGCSSCAAAQTCANAYYCASNQYVTNFQCSTYNGVGSWTASCASPTPTVQASTSSTFFNPILGVFVAAAIVAQL